MSSHIGTFKILIIGDSGIGKSSLMMRFVDGMFDPEISATIGKLLIHIVLLDGCLTETVFKLISWNNHFSHLLTLYISRILIHYFFLSIREFRIVLHYRGRFQGEDTECWGKQCEISHLGKQLIPSFNMP